MNLRRLPRTIRDILSTLRREMGWAGVIVGILCLPFVLIAAFAALPFVWAWRSVVRRRILPSHRTLSLEGEDLTFAWSGDNETARLALVDAVGLLIEAIAELPAINIVKSLKIRNPETGFAIDEEWLGAISENFVEHCTEALWGAKLEYGELVVNEVIVLAGFAVDCRSPLAGHLSLEFPGRWNPANTILRAKRLDFEVT